MIGIRPFIYFSWPSKEPKKCSGTLHAPTILINVNIIRLLTLIMPTKISNPSSSHPPPALHLEASESLISRTILAPVLFISFILSLLIVDRKTSTTIFSPTGSPLGSPGPRGSHGAGSHAYYHSHQRKLAKMEVDDAFAIRRRVIVAMCVFAGIGFVATVLVGLKLWTLLKG